MNPDLERLVTLQAQDIEEKCFREALADAPRRVAAAQSARNRAITALENTRTSLAQEEALRRRHESDIADRRTKISRLRRQLDAATSSAQVSAYEHEISFAEEGISKLEDEELASMERTEALEAQLASATAELQRTSAELEAAQAHAAVTAHRSTTALDALAVERSALRDDISVTDSGERALATYDRIAKGKGTAVAEATDAKCSACQMAIRPQRWNDLTGREHDHEIFSCETCGRLLFHDPRRNTPGAWPPGERLALAKSMNCH